MGGSVIPLLVGEKPTPKAGDDRVSLDYLSKLEKMPLLSSQGDGMKSFTGAVLKTLISPTAVTLLDEPEAFLHPPQARMLGQTLGVERKSGSQFFVSTHDRDFLHGLLDVASDKIRVIRLQRKGEVNLVSELNSAQIKDLWSDPLLRYSNILSGLFHENVILCESDGDCRFFQAMQDSLLQAEDHIPDNLYVHCNGKHRMPLIAKALFDLGVPLTVIPDLDILNNESPLKELIEAQGGDWPLLKAKWEVIKKEVEQQKLPLKRTEVKAQIIDILDKLQDEKIPEEAVKDIKDILKRTSPWAAVKMGGESILPAGNASTKYKELKIDLFKLGIKPIPVGELECFDKTIGNHGPKWVNEVLQKDLKTSPDLEEARKFCKECLPK